MTPMVTTSVNTLANAAIHVAAIVGTTSPAPVHAERLIVGYPAAYGMLIPTEQASRGVQWARATAVVAAWKRLPVDWDGEGAQPPASEIVDNAIRFLVLSEPYLRTAPKPYVDGPSEVGFKWKRGDGFASVSFMADGHIVAFARAPGETDTAFRLDVPFNDELNLQPLIKALSPLA